jgi:hypothetical protein
MVSWHSHATAASRNRSIRSDCAGGAQISHQESNGCSPDTEYLRQCLLREREDVVVDVVA